MALTRVLIVVTSHDRLGDNGAATGFWLEELSTPYYALIDTVIDVDIASIKGGVVPVDPQSEQDEWKTESAIRFQADVKATHWLENTLKIGTLRSEDYDAVYLAGGYGTMWDFLTDTSLAALLHDFNRSGKPIVAVCHGVARSGAVARYAGSPPRRRPSTDIFQRL